MENQYGSDRKSSDSKTLEDNTNMTMAVDYENEYGEKLGIETGLKFSIRNFGEDLNYLEDKYDNDYEEDIYAAYLVTKYDLTDRFGLKLEARFEQVETKANLSGPDPDSHDSTNIITKIFDQAISESPFDNPYTKTSCPSTSFSIDKDGHICITSNGNNSINIHINRWDLSQYISSSSARG